MKINVAMGSYTAVSTELPVCLKTLEAHPSKNEAKKEHGNHFLPVLTYSQVF